MCKFIKTKKNKKKTGKVVWLCVALLNFFQLQFTKFVVIPIQIPAYELNVNKLRILPNYWLLIC